MKPRQRPSRSYAGRALRSSTTTRWALRRKRKGGWTTRRFVEIETRAGGGGRGPRPTSHKPDRGPDALSRPGGTQPSEVPDEPRGGRGDGAHAAGRMLDPSQARAERTLSREGVFVISVDEDERIVRRALRRLAELPPLLELGQELALRASPLGAVARAAQQLQVLEMIRSALGLLLNPGRKAPIQTDLSMPTAATSGRSELVAGDNGFGLAFKADAL